ncbi:MAG TPA: ATP-binding protein [Pyrinomonadaceae bacterium]|nr:ATP-binding protein [Pyrinomonadaceae bacterium]
MLFRPKLFFKFLAVCIVPLLLLTAFNYWNDVRVIDGFLNRTQATALADFSRSFTRILNEDQEALKRLGGCKVVSDFAASRADSSFDSAHTSAVNSDSSEVPRDVALRVADVVNSDNDFTSVSLFGAERKAIFVALLQAGDREHPVVFQTKDFLTAQPQPDHNVWTARSPRLLASAISDTAGSRVYFSVPVNTAGNVGGAVVGELNLDLVFSRVTDTPNTATSTAMLVVLDRNGRILYHTNAALKHQFVKPSMPHFQPIAGQMFSSDNGNGRFTGTDGHEYATAFSRLPDLDLAVAVASNRDLLIADAQRTAVLTLIAALLLAAIAAAVLTRYWERRVRGIERVTQGVGAIAQGQLDHSFDLSSDDLRPLAANVGLVTQQLRDQIAREAESRQFESFVRLSASLTHDLKNAIEALSLTVTNMERHFENAEFRTDAMQTVRGATDNLRAIVTRLSQPVTTLSGEHKRPRSVDLVPMLRRVISMTAAQAEAHETIVKLPESLFAIVEIDRMQKVVENLIINSLEAMAGKNGKLTIEAGEINAGKVFFSVADTGDGMSKRFIQERLFHPFATTKKRGVGLGLYTCREVVRAHGGTIEVSSEEGAGTTFRVVLPSAPLESRR